MVVELILGLVALFLLWQTFFKKPAGLPPGRWGLPLIGYIPLTMKTLEEQLDDLYKKHGDIYVWRMGTQVMVFLHDYKLTRTAFAGADFIDRPDWNLFNFFEEIALGIGGSNDSIWRNNRHFSLHQLRDLGMGKSKLVGAVQAQATKLVDELKKQAGEAKPVPHALNVAVVNVIWQMVGGHQFELTDPKMIEFEEIIKDMLSASALASVPDFLPWITSILPKWILRDVFQYGFFENAKERFLQFFLEEIEEHRATLDRDNPRDLIDGYLIEMDEKKDDPATTCSDKDLAILSLDLFFAGSETTRSTLVWMFYYLATYPEVQRRLQDELDEVLPKGTLVTLDDRIRLPYTEAVLHEVLRKSSLLSLGGQHVAVRDTQLGGYFIPKGSVINSSATTMHHDPRYWDHPNEFLPERWLDPEGKFATKKMGFLPFGVGKRVCLGESLARMELLIFSATVLQNFSFSHPPDKDIDIRPEPNNPFMHSPKTQDIFISIRQ
ncbi:cytochrome P450 2L1-like [Panulirus ornatus]|uniref:cytochrome P450 2L1-like n=1 Tax=Panulirus ornatus TaxID=150431 RepID=UPI003A8A75A2